MSVARPGSARSRVFGVRGGWRWAVGLLLFATPILAVNAPQDVRIPSLKARAAPPSARFSHWEHGAQHCYACHPGVFPQALQGFTHQDMREGRYCGSCHEGRTAKSITAMRCETCHAPR